jgi:hypothetical protein
MREAAHWQLDAVGREGGWVWGGVEWRGGEERHAGCHAAAFGAKPLGEPATTVQTVDDA